VGKLLMAATVFQGVANQVSHLSQPDMTLRQCDSCPYPFRDRAPTVALSRRGCRRENQSVANRDQNLTPTGSNGALGYVVPDAGPVGVGGAGFDVVVVGRSGPTRPMNVPPLAVSSCSKLSSSFRLIICGLPEFVCIWLSRSWTLSTVTRITLAYSAHTPRGRSKVQSPRGNRPHGYQISHFGKIHIVEIEL
jgi:hypothetical protein